MVVTIFGAAVWLLRLKPEHFKNYGHPVALRSSAGGWTTYRFADLGIEIDLPSAPRTVANNLRRWDPAYRSDVRAYGDYRLTAFRETFRIDGRVFRFGESSTPEDAVAGKVEHLRADSHYSGLSYTVTSQIIAGRQATVATYKYGYNGIPRVEREAFFMAPKSFLSIRLYAYVDDGASGTNFNRIVASLRFVPAGEGV